MAAASTASSGFWCLRRPCDGGLVMEAHAMERTEVARYWRAGLSAVGSEHLQRSTVGWRALGMMDTSSPFSGKFNYVPLLELIINQISLLGLHLIFFLLRGSLLTIYHFFPLLRGSLLTICHFCQRGILG